MLTFLENPTVLLINNDAVVVCLYYLMQRKFYDRKEWTKKRVWLMVGVYLLTVACHVGINLLGYVALNMTAAILCYLAPLFICFKVKNIRGIAYFFFYLACMVGVEGVVGMLMGGIIKGQGMHLDYSAANLGGYMMMDLLEFFLCQLICYFGNRDKDKRLDRVALLFMMMPVTSVIIAVAEVLRIQNYAGEEYSVEQFAVMLFIMVLINIVFFFVLEMYTKLMKKDVDLMQKEMKMQSDADLMEMAAKAMKERLSTAEEMMSKDREMRHDRRHFEAMLLTLLQEGNASQAQKYLSERLAIEPKAAVRYCDNVPVNAALTHYIKMAEREGIKVNISVNIPAKLEVDEMQLAIALSNLIENAIHACERLPESERYIGITARYKEQLLVEIVNSCEGRAELDEDGHPFTSAEGHGTGTRSVLAFANRTESEIRYKAEEKRFSVRMII